MICLCSMFSRCNLCDIHLHNNNPQLLAIHFFLIKTDLEEEEKSLQLNLNDPVDR